MIAFQRTLAQAYALAAYWRERAQMLGHVTDDGFHAYVNARRTQEHAAEGYRMMREDYAAVYGGDEDT